MVRMLQSMRVGGPLVGAAIAGAVTYSMPRSFLQSSASEDGGGKKTDRCRPVVICGPSGVGKSTLIRKLQKEFEGKLGFSISHTTRDPRSGEKDGEHYHFISMEDMQAAIDRHEFVEFAKVHQKMYGTSKKAVADVSDQGKVCLLDIDIQGVEQCRAADAKAAKAAAADGYVGSLAKYGGIDAAAYVFVAPPSLGELERRLRGRGTESEDKIQIRLQNALGEMRDANHVNWTAWVINDDVDAAYASMRDALLPVLQECDRCNAAAGAGAGAASQKRQ